MLLDGGAKGATTESQSNEQGKSDEASKQSYEQELKQQATQSKEAIEMLHSTTAILSKMEKKFSYWELEGQDKALA